MIKSIAGNYRDITAMAPIVNINADILYKVWVNVFKIVSNLGFNVTDIMTDEHSSNVNFFQSYLKVYCVEIRMRHHWLT